MGVKSVNPPIITTTSTAVVHPSYVDALNLQKIVVSSLDPDLPLRAEGLIVDLPDGIGMDTYQDRLAHLSKDLEGLPQGKDCSRQFEDIVAETVRLCFYRSLGNLEERVRDVNGTVIRDLIASNIAPSGFWEIIRSRYGAVQIIWECKNYDDLHADDFHQATYYMSPAIGNFVIVVFRGEIKNHYYDHIKRIAEIKNGMVLLLTEKDIKVFLRQAINGKVKEAHIHEIYDKMIRAIS
jgi:hypothetical protein